MVSPPHYWLTMYVSIATCSPERNSSSSLPEYELIKQFAYHAAGKTVFLA